MNSSSLAKQPNREGLGRCLPHIWSLWPQVTVSLSMLQGWLCSRQAWASCLFTHRHVRARTRTVRGSC